MPAIYDRNADAGIFFLEEVLRQAGIPLLRSHDARKLLQMTGEWLNTTGLISSPRNIVADAFALLSCPTPETGKSKFSPLPAFP
ncbi:Uncharacterised protein [Klebsiella pneumoniae]|nr:Uncharacterised protein [Klebsiella pneumoniae]